jgi:hypothetical protein
MPPNSAKRECKIWVIESVVGAIKAVRIRRWVSEMFSAPRATLKETGMILVNTVSVVWTFLFRG